MRYLYARHMESVKERDLGLPGSLIDTSSPSSELRRLFVAECVDRVDAGGAASRNIGREHGDDCEKHGYSREREGIAGGDAEKEAGGKSSQTETGCESDREPDSGERCALTKDGPENVALFSAENQANAKLETTLPNRVGVGAVEAGSGQEDGEDRERGEQGSLETRLGNRVGAILVERLNREERNRAVDGGSLRLRVRDERVGIESGARDEG